MSCGGGRQTSATQCEFIQLEEYILSFTVSTVFSNFRSTNGSQCQQFSAKERVGKAYGGSYQWISERADFHVFILGSSGTYSWFMCKRLVTRMLSSRCVYGGIFQDTPSPSAVVVRSRETVAFFCVDLVDVDLAWSRWGVGRDVFYSSGHEETFILWVLLLVRSGSHHLKNHERGPRPSDGVQHSRRSPPVRGCSCTSRPKFDLRLDLLRF